MSTSRSGGVLVALGARCGLQPLFEDEHENEDDSQAKLRRFPAASVIFPIPGKAG